MGKRLPRSKKHKKLKFVDPCYKGPLHHARKRHLFNEPPADDNDQEIPRGMIEFAANKSRTKKKKKKKTFKDDFIIVETPVEENQPGMEKPLKKMPKTLKQKKGEDSNQFINRLQKMADKALAEAKIEEKYNIELVNVDKEGNAQYRSSNTEEINEGKRKKRQKYKDKMKEKKMKKLEEKDEDFELKKDKIAFGDIVAAPPIFSSKPRGAPELNKPGKRKLKLRDSLSEKRQNINTTLDRRKELENEQRRAIQMYRLLKQKKNM